MYIYDMYMMVTTNSFLSLRFSKLRVLSQPFQCPPMATSDGSDRVGLKSCLCSEADEIPQVR